MAEAILGATGALYGWLLTYLLHSAVLLGAVWGLVRLRWVRNPATQDVLWKVALLGSIITATASTMRDAPARQDGPRAMAIHAVPTASDGSVVAGGGTGIVHWRGVPVPTRSDVPAEADLAAPSETCRTALSSLPDDHTTWPRILGEACQSPRAFLWQHGVVFLWILGALLTGGLLVRRRLTLRDALGDLRPAGPRSRGALERVTDSGPRLRVRLLASATADAPCVIRGSTVVLPDRCEEQLSDEELDAVLAHELAHVHRRDVVWLALLRWVEALFWLQPLNRMGVTGALTATELECDDWAVERTGRPLGLARSLARVAEWSLPSRGALQADIALARGKRRHLSERVSRILTPGRRRAPGSPWGRTLAALMVVAPAFMLPSVPGAPVVRREILYRVESADGGAPMTMLLSAVQELEELPANFRQGKLGFDPSQLEKPAR